MRIRISPVWRIASIGEMAEARLAGISADINTVIKLMKMIRHTLHHGTTVRIENVSAVTPCTIPVEMILPPTRFRVIDIPMIPTTIPRISPAIVCKNTSKYTEFRFCRLVAPILANIPR